jgi:glutamate-5-semialdehyde dehydrogenase
MNYLEQLGIRAKKAASCLNLLMQDEKNKGLQACAQALLNEEADILAANEQDVQAAIANGMKSSLVDRLRLNPKRIKEMADGLLQICSLPVL